MISLEKLSNKKFAFSCIKLLNEKEIEILTSEDECKRLFNCSKFPILFEVKLGNTLENDDCYDEQGRQRYYKEKIFIGDRAFVISNHWYGPNKSMPDNRTPFIQWITNKMA